MTRLSLVLPCYNEAARLPTTLRAHLDALPTDPEAVEVIVVDDGSTDATRAVAQAVADSDARVRVLLCPVNRGKGFAVRTGMLAARGALLAFTDADGSYSPDQVARVVAALDTAPVAIGARNPGDGAGEPVRRMASRVFNVAIRGLIGLAYRDTQCGLKAFRHEAAEAIFTRTQVDGFAFDAEVLLLAGQLGYPVVEVEVRAEQRAGTKVRLALDAVRMLRDSWRVRRRAAAGAYERAPSG